jgi:hypothetical protein
MSGVSPPVSFRSRKKAAGGSPNTRPRYAFRPDRTGLPARRVQLVVASPRRGKRLTVRVGAQ